jgi:hypothetical protein
MKNIIALSLFVATSFAAIAQEPFNLKTYEENGKFGLLNAEGDKITLAKYDEFIGEFCPL